MGQQERAERGERGERAEHRAPRKRIWHANGLRLRALRCPWCGHHFGNEAIERGYMEKLCPECKAACQFPIDRTNEVRNYDAYIYQERQALLEERLPPERRADMP